MKTSYMYDGVSYLTDLNRYLTYSGMTFTSIRALIYDRMEMNSTIIQLQVKSEITNYLDQSVIIHCFKLF